LWRGVTDAEVHAGLRPVVTAGMALGLGAGVMTALGILAAEGVLPRWATGAVVHLGSYGLAAVVWLALMVVVLRSSPDGASPPRWSACIAGLMGMAVLVEVPVSPGWGERLLSVTFVLLAMSLAFAGAVTRLRSVTVHDSQRQRRLQAALVATRRRAVREQALTRAWRHDLRNAALGLQAVEAVLRTVEIESPAAMDELSRAVSAELSRLRALVELPRSQDPTDVDLAAVLGPLLAAERCQGACIDADLGSIRVRADKGSLCRVVQNLLVNARRHAGGRVDLRAVPRDGEVEIWIRDHGPGMPADQRRSLFRRTGNSARAAGNSGSRLGLAIAQNLIEEMGGRIRLIADGEHGACFVLTLPAAGATARSVDVPLGMAGAGVS
ncbi:MAG: sensor histidine kinase, partial [Trebonia sp.]